MDRSQYLARALAAMSAPQQPAPQSMAPADMAKAAQGGAGGPLAGLKALAGRLLPGRG